MRADAVKAVILFAAWWMPGYVAAQSPIDVLEYPRALEELRSGMVPPGTEIIEPLVSRNRSVPALPEHLTVQRVGAARAFLIFDSDTMPFALSLPVAPGDPGLHVDTWGTRMRSEGTWLPRLGRVANPQGQGVILSSDFSGPGIPEGRDPVREKLHLYLSANPGAWKRDVPVFRSVFLRQILDGIDATVRSGEFWTETEFILAPGTSTSGLVLQHPIEPQGILADGRLVTEFGLQRRAILQPAVEFFQIVGGVTMPVDGRVVMPSTGSLLQVSLPAIDPSAPLHIRVRVMRYRQVLDSDLAAATIEIVENGAAAAKDGKGHVYVVGFGSIWDLEGQAERPSPTTVVTQFDEVGATQWTALLSASPGSGEEQRVTAVTDAEGNLLVAGFTTSPNAFPTDRAEPVGSSALFVTRIDARGALRRSVLLPLNGGDASVTGLALRGHGEACVAANAQFPGAPIKGGQGWAGGSTDGYVACLELNAPDPLRFSTYVGGSADDTVNGIATGPAGSIYVVGTTGSPDLRGHDPARPRAGFADAFVTRIDPRAKSDVLRSLYLGGDEDSEPADAGIDVKLASDGTVWVVGHTRDPNIAKRVKSGRVASSEASHLDVFAMGFDPSLETVERAFTLGSSLDDHATSMATDSAGNLYLAVVSGAADFPALGATTPLPAANHSNAERAEQLIVTKINSVQTAVLWSASLGRTSRANNTGVLDLTLDVDTSGRVWMPLVLRGHPDALDRTFAAQAAVDGTSVVRVGTTGAVLPPPRIATMRVEGDTLVIFGAGFHASTKVLLDNVVAAASLTGNTLLVPLPNSARNVRVDVLNEDHQSATSRIVGPPRSLASSVTKLGRGLKQWAAGAGGWLKFLAGAIVAIFFLGAVVYLRNRG